MSNNTKTTPDSTDHGLDVLGNITSLVTLAQAAKLLAKVGDNHIHTSTLWRWCKDGVRGVYLEYGRMGRFIVTTPEALGRFFVALARQDTKRQSLPARTRRRVRSRTSDQRQRDIEQAHAILVKANHWPGPAERESLRNAARCMPPNAFIEVWRWDDGARKPLIKALEELPI